jgi:hypothetical protein
MTVLRLYFKQKAELDVRPEDVASIELGSTRDMIVEIGDATYVAHRIERVERTEDTNVPLA